MNSLSAIHYYTRNRYGKGSGFLTKLSFQGAGSALLVTCNHVIPSVEIAKNCDVSFDRLDDDTPGTLFSGKDLFDLSSFMTDETTVSS